MNIPRTQVWFTLLSPYSEACAEPRRAATKAAKVTDNMIDLLNGTAAERKQ